MLEHERDLAYKTLNSFFFGRVWSREICFAAASTKVSKTQNCKSHKLKSTQRI
jgi:hypothetical protein